MRLDEGAIPSQIPDSYGPAGVKGSPEGAEHLKPDPRPSIRRRVHHHWMRGVCKVVTTLTLGVFIERIAFGNRQRLT